MDHGFVGLVNAYYQQNEMYHFFVYLQALNQIGLRVVLDVVYNHLHGSGPLDENSVLDKVIFYDWFSISTYASSNVVWFNVVRLSSYG